MNGRPYMSLSLWPGHGLGQLGFLARIKPGSFMLCRWRGGMCRWQP